MARCAEGAGFHNGVGSGRHHSLGESVKYQLPDSESSSPPLSSPTGDGREVVA